MLWGAPDREARRAHTASHERSSTVEPPAAVALVPARAEVEALPSPAILAELPSAERVEAPWEGARAAASAEIDELRIALLNDLFAERDQVSARADRDFLERIARQCGTNKLDLPLFPDAVVRLDRVLRRKESSVREVAQIVRREAELARRVWQEADSAHYLERASTLDEAIVRVGFEPLWRIGMRACMNAPVFRVRGFQRQANHVRAVSIVTAELATTLRSGGEVFLAGLLHAIGKLLVYRAAVVRPNQPAPGVDLVERIARAYHPSVGAIMARSWKMPQEVCSAIAFVPDPLRLADGELQTAMAVRAACIATHTAAEARAHRDVGGLLALMDLPAIQFDPGQLIARAHTVWDGLKLSGDLKDLGASPDRSGSGC